MRRLWFIIFTLLLLSLSFALAYEKEIKGLSLSVVEGIVKEGKKMVAVVDFVDLQGNITELGRFIGEELSVDLVKEAKGFEVIDRIHLKVILAEHKISMSGLVDPKTVKKLGQIAGVDAIVTGCVTPFGDSIRVTCKVITTDKTKVVGAGKADIPKTKAIEELLAREIEGSVITTKPITPPKPAAKVQQSVEAKGFLFELQSCKLSGNSVTCNLLITNKKEDRNLVVIGKGSVYDHEPTKIFDDSGNEYWANEVQLANKRNKIVQSLLISDIPTKVSFSFDGVSQNAKSITLLKISCYDGYYGRGGGEKFLVQFRNIPLTK